MLGRGSRTIFVTLAVAVMVGFREATGVAPPPPLLSLESVEWLSPEPDDDLPPIAFVEDAPPMEITAPSAPEAPPQAGVKALVTGWLRRLLGSLSSPHMPRL